MLTDEQSNGTQAQGAPEPLCTAPEGPLALWAVGDGDTGTFWQEVGQGQALKMPTEHDS